MNIQKNEIFLVDDTYKYIYRTSEKVLADTFKKELTKYIGNINNLITVDFKTLSDEEFYDLVCKVYSISLTEEDYLKIISKKNGKNYNILDEIGTYMTSADTVTTGKGRDFEWHEQLYQVRYIVAVSDDTNIEYDCTLSKKKIMEMINNKSIVIVGSKLEPLNTELELYEEMENMPSMDIDLSDSFYVDGIYGDDICGDIWKDDNFPVVISILRKKITKKRILRDMKDYIEELQEQIKEVLSSKYDDAYNETSRLCNAWYRNSEEKKLFKSIQNKLKNL